MKKLFFILCFTVFSFSGILAQTEFGGKVGFNSMTLRAATGGAAGSDSVSGYYVGFFADIYASEKFHVQPEAQLVVLSQNGARSNMIVVPVMGKYYVSEQFNLQFGPQIDIILDETDLNKFGFGFAAGLGLDINEDLQAVFRYSLGLSNRLDDPSLLDAPSDTTIKLNFLQLGLGYKF